MHGLILKRLPEWKFVKGETKPGDKKRCLEKIQKIEFEAPAAIPMTGTVGVIKFVYSTKKSASNDFKKVTKETREQFVREIPSFLSYDKIECTERKNVAELSAILYADFLDDRIKTGSIVFRCGKSIYVVYGALYKNAKILARIIKSQID